MRLISYAELREGDLVAVSSKKDSTVSYYFVLSISKDARRESYLLFLITTSSSVQVKRMSRGNQNIFTTKGVLLRGCN